MEVTLSTTLAISPMFLLASKAIGNSKLMGKLKMRLCGSCLTTGKTAHL